MKKTTFLFYYFCFFSFSLSLAQVIPAPVKMEKKEGSFLIDPNSSIVVDEKDEESVQIAEYLTERIEAITGYRLKLQSNVTQNSIVFRHTNSPELGEEGYVLDVDKENIFITYHRRGGAFYAVQSLLQFLPMVRTNATPTIQAVEIKDYPQYAWRGMMLDVSRHFFTVETIKKTLDMLAFYKINKFHWHLCDNEGWRLEIKKYPKLTEIGAWRLDMPYSRIYQKDYRPIGKPYRYGGYYTQDEAKEIVAYAERLNITVIPEIEMPDIPVLHWLHIRSIVVGKPPMTLPTNYCTNRKSIAESTAKIIVQETTLRFTS